MNRFDGKVVLVTGAGIGIGYEICRGFAASGALVMLNDIDPNSAEQAAQSLNQEFDRRCVFAYPFDNANVAAIRKTVASIVERFGGLHIAVANAGITHIKPFLETEPDDLDRLLAVNLRGTYFVAQASAQAMIAQRTAGRIVIMSSVTGIQAIPNFSAYGITKAGLRQMARILAVELGAHGITVNAVAPGATVTERTLHETADYEATWAEVIPTHRPAYVGDIAAATLFLASDEARQITGQTLTVDGGWTAYSPLPGYTAVKEDQNA
jgi:3-oxoacyl-[acyl-carrier protein] reductase